jgi:hypothetical protein
VLLVLSAWTRERLRGLLVVGLLSLGCCSFDLNAHSFDWLSNQPDVFLRSVLAV